MASRVVNKHSSPGLYDSYSDIKYKKPGRVSSNKNKITNKSDDAAYLVRVQTPKFDYSKEYLTIEALENNCCVYFTNFDESTSYTNDFKIEYSKNKKEWDEVTCGVYTPQTSGILLPTPFIELNKEEKIYLKGNNEAYSDGSFSGGSNYHCVITCLPSSCNNVIDYTSISTQHNTIFNISGNIMSLIYGDDFKDKTELTEPDYTFEGLFSMNTYLESCENLVLPAIALGEWTYGEMFYYCVNLKKAPNVLLSKTLCDFCYACMFIACTGLTSTPELPATTLSNCCYRNMFASCISLTTAPNLPATTLALGCYEGMFQGCTSLTQAPELPATTLAENCYKDMFQRCTSLTTAPVLPATTLAEACYVDMFQDCTSLTTAPAVLPATTLAQYCYYYMFEGCTSLTQAPELPATTLAYGCYDRMFSGCTSLTTAPELPATTLVSSCYSHMFAGCTGLTTAPELPATTLARYCYAYMFYGCTSLNYIKCLATNISATECTYNWVKNVSSSGTFVVPNSMQSTWYNKGTGGNGKPNGWTYQDV